MPKYQDISYKYNHTSIILFESDAITLVVNYDKETYEKEKDNESAMSDFVKKYFKYDF